MIKKIKTQDKFIPTKDIRKAHTAEECKALFAALDVRPETDIQPERIRTVDYTRALTLPFPTLKRKRK